MGGERCTPHRVHRVALGTRATRRARGPSGLGPFDLPRLQALPMRARAGLPRDRTSRGGTRARGRDRPRWPGDDAARQLLGIRDDDARRGRRPSERRRPRGDSPRRASALRSAHGDRRRRDRRWLAPPFSRPARVGARTRRRRTCSLRSRAGRPPRRTERTSGSRIPTSTRQWRDSAAAPTRTVGSPQLCCSPPARSVAVGVGSGSRRASTSSPSPRGGRSARAGRADPPRGRGGPARRIGPFEPGDGRDVRVVRAHRRNPRAAHPHEARIHIPFGDRRVGGT